MVARNFVWYELSTPNKALSEAFYAAVVGWKIVDVPKPDLRYSLGLIGERPTVGFLEEEIAEGTPPGWLGYVSVEDVGATIAEYEAEGGRAACAPRTIAEVGTFAVVLDPQGAALGLLTPDFDTTLPPMMTPGSIGWHELWTSDPVAGFDFYAARFAWIRDQAFPMPGIGDYQLFATDRGAIGGMMRVERAPRPFWLFYFAVNDIDAAVERVKAAGGDVRLGPTEVPGGAFIVQGTDPQGIHFALVGLRRAA